MNINDPSTHFLIEFIGECLRISREHDRLDFFGFYQAKQALFRLRPVVFSNWHQDEEYLVGSGDRGEVGMATHHRVYVNR